MSNLNKWKKTTPISIEHQIKPFLGLHKTIKSNIKKQTEKYMGSWFELNPWY